MTRALRRGAVRYRPPVSVAAPALEQSTSNFIQPGATTYSATFTDAVTAGNALVWVVAFDKQPGTLTMSGTGWTVPVNLRSTSVSLAIAWKVAAGTETSLSGSASGGNVSGCRVWIGELSQSGAGAWQAVSASSNSDETTVSTKTSGTTAAAAVLSRAIAAFALDSVSNRGTSVSYTNGFTSVFAPVTEGDGGEAGLWVASASIAAGAAATTTISRIGGSTDQMSGGILLLGRT